MLSYERNQIIDLSTNHSNAGCSINWMNGQQYYHCYNSMTFSSHYPRLWYIALARFFFVTFAQKRTKLFVNTMSR
nr:hypothetical protein BaRGS_022146 [Batillaria attramentaria]